MIRFALALALSSAVAGPLAGKRVVFLGDSITQAGGYVAFTTYYLEKHYPKKDFDVLGLASETLSGLSEDGHLPRQRVLEPGQAAPQPERHRRAQLL